MCGKKAQENNLVVIIILKLVGRIRKRTIYIDTDLDKEFAKAAIDAEVTYSDLAVNLIRSHLQTLKKKRGS